MAQTHHFQSAEDRLLHMLANSIYTKKEIALRELISNASDAVQKYQLESRKEPGIVHDEDPRILIVPDEQARTLTISDNGIGMNRDTLISDLGTIARSGTSAYLQEHQDDEGADLSTIGQFGVGFYSAFMVASDVEVVSRRAGEDQAWRWASDGTGEFTIAEAERERRRSVAHREVARVGVDEERVGDERVHVHRL